MIGLMLKDLLNLKRHSKVYLLLIIFYFVIGIINESSVMFSSMITLVAAMLPITAMAYDEKSKWDRYALTMPLSRVSLVLSKYILSMLFLIPVFIISMVFNLLFSDILLNDIVLINGVLLIVGIVLISVIFPVFFKYGAEKGRIILMLILFVPTGIVLILSKFGFALQNEDVLKLKYFLYFVPVIAIAVLALSILISISIYNKKEF